MADFGKKQADSSAVPKIPGVARRRTRTVRVGPVAVGGDAPVTVQSMTKTSTHDRAATAAQIHELAAAGCDIVRVAVPDFRAVRALARLVSESPIPVVADVHFDARLALESIAAGVHAVRINPGNLKGPGKLFEIARAAAAAGAALRVGVNSGSLEPELRRTYGGATPEALAESAVRACRRIEETGFGNIKVSIKSSSVRVTVAANRLFAARTDYPLHLGVTEAGTRENGIVKSAVGIGALLLEGIGDTIRVSLTAPPVEEVEAGLRILEACGLRKTGPDIVACPTCGRTEIALFPLARAVEREVRRLRAAGYRFPFAKIAVMGCPVNGPGEARDADIGIAGGKGKGLLFKHGRVVATLPEAELLPALVRELRAAAIPPPDPRRESRD